MFKHFIPSVEFWDNEQVAEEDLRDAGAASALANRLSIEVPAEAGAGKISMKLLLTQKFFMM